MNETYVLCLTRDEAFQLCAANKMARQAMAYTDATGKDKGLQLKLDGSRDRHLATANSLADKIDKLFEDLAND